jgi:hypothetical protein
MDDPLVQYMLHTVLLTNIHISGESRNATETVQGSTSPTSAGGWSQLTNTPVNVPGLGAIRDTRRRK